MEFSRSDRVAEEIKRVTSEIIATELKDPRIKGLVSVTGVDVTKDLRNAKIYVSIFGDESTKQESFEGLKSAEQFVRREIGKRVVIKYLPEITFILDESIENGFRIDKLLEEVKKQDETKNDERKM